MQLALLARLNAARRARRSALLVTDLATGAQELLDDEIPGEDDRAGVFRAFLQSGLSGRLDHEGRSLFVEVHRPPPRLLIIGAGHIAQALVPMARMTSFDPVLLDPRTAFATPERFPDVPLLAEWPQDVLPGNWLDVRTAVAALSHDPRIDDLALSAALKADCFYIGALGSRKTHGKRLERLRAAGFGEASLARLHAPIGLDIGAVSPAEIAVSIIAEIIAASGRKPLRGSGGPQAFAAATSGG